LQKAGDDGMNPLELGRSRNICGLATVGIMLLVLALLMVPSLLLPPLLPPLLVRAILALCLVVGAVSS
jgi:hypothetical protein